MISLVQSKNEIPEAGRTYRETGNALNGESWTTTITHAPQESEHRVTVYFTEVHRIRHAVSPSGRSQDSWDVTYVFPPDPEYFDLWAAELTAQDRRRRAAEIKQRVESEFGAYHYFQIDPIIGAAVRNHADDADALAEARVWASAEAAKMNTIAEMNSRNRVIRARQKAAIEARKNQ